MRGDGLAKRRAKIWALVKMQRPPKMRMMLRSAALRSRRAVMWREEGVVLDFRFEISEGGGGVSKAARVTGRKRMTSAQMAPMRPMRLAGKNTMARMQAVMAWAWFLSLGKLMAA